MDRQSSLEPEQRRRAASLSTPHRASDVHVDPNQSAILFRDARGVGIFMNLRTLKSFLNCNQVCPGSESFDALCMSVQWKIEHLEADASVVSFSERPNLLPDVGMVLTAVTIRLDYL